ncbi:hypothetical protein EIP86_008712 [Pleurotus ostreatoroseus]|nr:hypothetical protein EIP86_008712 [Pleurotus ostreatoroseus]
MLPVALLGSAVYLVRALFCLPEPPLTCVLLDIPQALRLTQHTLSHERFLDDARARVHELELEIGELRQRQLLEPPASDSGTTKPAETGAKKRGWLW